MKMAFGNKIFPFQISILVFTLFYEIATKPPEVYKLVKLIVTARHGARAPLEAGVPEYLQIKNMDKLFPSGPQELTKKGKVEMKKYGEIFRQRYSHFIDKYLLREKKKNLENILSVRSTDVQRSFESASLIVSAFGENSKIKVTKDSPDKMKITYESRRCKRYMAQRSVRMQTSMPRQIKDLQLHIKSKTKKDSLIELDPMFFLVGAIQSLEAHEYNAEIPGWVDDKMKKILIPNYLHALWATHFDTPSLIKMLAGPLSEEIAEIVKSGIEGNERFPDVFIFLGHDSTIFGILSTLQLMEREIFIVGYGASVIFEIYEKVNESDGKYYVKTVFSESAEAFNKNGGVGKVISLKNCGEYCPLDTFLNFFDNVKVKSQDWVAMCNQQVDQNEPISTDRYPSIESASGTSKSRSIGGSSSESLSASSRSGRGKSPMRHVRAETKSDADSGTTSRRRAPSGSPPRTIGKISKRQ